MKYFKKLVESYSNPLWIIFVIFLLVYNYFIKKHIIILSLTKDLKYNMWDVFFGVLCDPFFIIYFILPILIMISSKLINDSWKETNLVRLLSYRNWLKYSLIEASQIFICLIGLICSIAIVVSFELPLTLNWSEYSSNNLLTNFATYYLNSNNVLPPIALIIQILNLMLFSLIIHSILTLFYLFFQKPVATFGFGLVIWLGIIISFKVFTNYMWLNISNYISVPLTYKSFSTWYYPFIGYLFVLILVSFGGRFKK